MTKTLLSNLKFHLVLFIFIVAGTGLSNLLQVRAQTACNISTASSTSVRTIQVNVSCPNAKFFKLSDSSNFKETSATAPTVKITNVDPAGEYADVSVTYPAGVPAATSQPFSVTSQSKTLRALVVLYDFNGELAPPSYATPAWANKLVFGSDFDGRGLPNSLKDYIVQNSYGQVTLTGGVYPGVLHLDPLSNMRYLTVNSSYTGEYIAKRVADKLVEVGHIDPANNPYDMLLGLSAGGFMASAANFYSLYSYNNGWNYQGFKSQLNSDLPIDSTSPLWKPITNEVSSVDSSGIVMTRYNAAAVSGVWLKSDPNHTDTNYFGSVVYGYQDPDYNFSNRYVKYIKLNQVLAAGTEVLVNYTPAKPQTISDQIKGIMAPDTMINQHWFGAWAHESMHTLSSALSVPPVDAKTFIADTYNHPWEITREYDMMASGNTTVARVWNTTLGQNVNYSNPAHLSGHIKAKLGLVTPHRLTYGENTLNLRLYRSEEVNFTNTNGRVKLVKVPLHPAGDQGFLQLVGNSNNVRKYTGEDYLLLEWRSKAGLPGSHSFDGALPHQGMVVYRMVESRTPPSPIIGDDLVNTIHIQDATPPLPPFSSLTDLRSKMQSSILLSAATYGPDSGVYEYIASEPWSWKELDTATADFQLSPSDGTKTIHAKFMDLNGNIIATTSTTTTLKTTGTVTGKVSNRGGSAIANARVNLTVNGVNYTYTTNSQGVYQIPNLPVGAYSIRYSATGYRAKTYTVNVTAGDTTTQIVTLQK